MYSPNLQNTIYNSILELATPDGINASGKDDIYGCIFGRDSFITILKLLNVYTNTGNKNEMDMAAIKDICKRSLVTLINLQGRQTNIESGEAPGKFIHEYRKDKYERLIQRPRPWYVYPDKILRNYDSLDSTPLGLIAIHRFWQKTGDDAFLLQALPAVEAGLNWIITYGDQDKDLLLEYELPKNRTHGGLVVQSWTDSRESLERLDGSFPVYPIAPVEVQGYAWLALRLWADFYADTRTHYAKTEKFSEKLRIQAKQMKKNFNLLFIADVDGYDFPVQALDGQKNQIPTVTGNSLLLLWATYIKNGKPECILDDNLVPSLVKRSFLPDMFDPAAGVRTMAARAATFNAGADSYHNGSFWPKLNGMCHEGLIKWGYGKEAEKLRLATLKPIKYFGTPIELYIKGQAKDTYLPFSNAYGQQSCKTQAWSAAVALDLLTQ
jgi:glycogen debranching enzyme